jgi:hypothetical protein
MFFFRRTNKSGGKVVKIPPPLDETNNDGDTIITIDQDISVLIDKDDTSYNLIQCDKDNSIIEKSVYVKKSHRTTGKQIVSAMLRFWSRLISYLSNSPDNYRNILIEKGKEMLKKKF